MPLSNPSGIPPEQTIFKSGYYNFLTGLGSSGTSAALGNGSLRLMPVWVDAPIALSRIGCEVTIIGDAGSTYTIAIYSDLAHAPGGLLYDSSASGSASTILANGKIAGDSATVQEITVNWPLPIGLYWIGGVLQGVTVTQPTFRIPVNPHFLVPMQTTIITAGQAPMSTMTQTGVTGALPGTMTPVPTSVLTPRVFAKVA